MHRGSAAYTAGPWTASLTVAGQPLDPDHGYPCRLIAPARPGVLQTMWVHELEVVPA